jgi:hypothetical protein
MLRDDKLSKFGEGPWVDEADRLEFEACGLPCLITRNPLLGTMCGYVAVPPGHPLHGVSYRVASAALDVHGGVNYSQRCDDEVCHKAKPGEPDDVWWFGFHCACGWDLLPYMSKWLGCPRDGHGDLQNYRDLNFVRVECESLAVQLAALVPQ